MSTPAAIVDYGLGNLFSIQQACRVAGITAEITDDPKCILSAPLVILPGVGAFGDAMAALTARDLTAPLTDYAASGRPLFGICLGMQLLMDESSEFGHHTGLGLIPGTVERLPSDQGMKVPQIGWLPVDGEAQKWAGTPLEGIGGGTYFYFVHSYRVRPRNPRTILASTRFGSIEYCTAIRSGSVFGVQFHPERSAKQGVTVYANLSRFVQASEALMATP